MKGHGAKFGRKREEAIVALLSYGTLDEAASAVGVSPVTLWRWTQNPDFAREYTEARRAAVGRAIGELQALAAAATRTLREVMESPESPAATRVSAARTVLDNAIRAVELEDLDARIAALERIVKAKAA